MKQATFEHGEPLIEPVDVVLAGRVLVLRMDVPDALLYALRAASGV